MHLPTRSQNSSPCELKGTDTSSTIPLLRNNALMPRMSSPSGSPFDRLPWSGSKYSSNLARSCPRSASPNSFDQRLEAYLPNLLDYVLHMHLQTRSIAFSKRISEFTPAWPASVYPILINHGLQVRMIMASKCMAKLALSRPPSDSKFTR